MTEQSAAASSPSIDLEQHLGYLLRRVSNRVSSAFARALQEKQISVAEWVVLAQIQAAPSIRPADLSSAIGMTRGAVSKIVEKLEAKDWIVRTAVPEDGRSQTLSLTRHGRRILPQLLRMADRNDELFFDCLKPGEKQTLRGILNKLAEVHQIREMPVE